VESIETELFGGEPATTNNRMELRAVIEALQSLRQPVEARIYTDSQYVQKGISIIGSDAAGKQRAMSPSRMRICGVVSMR
jgi:ribonuclease HI